MLCEKVDGDSLHTLGGTDGLSIICYAYTRFTSHA
jgi:hypothetical protein